jgi:peroxiredoxin
MKNTFFLLVAALTLLSAATLPFNNGLKPGDKAPDFKLKNVDDRMVSMADFKEAKGFIVTFTCNTCPYAVMYEDRLIELHNKFAPLGYPVIAIQPNDPAAQPGDAFDKMKERAKEKGFPFVYLFDEGQKIYPMYGASRTPEIYLLDKSLTVRYTGAIDDNAQNADAVTVRYVEDAIAALEKGKQPEPATVKAIGCTIKVKKA